MYAKDIERISKVWAAETDFTKTFYGYPPLRDFNRLRTTGQTEEWEYVYFLHRLLGDKLPVSYALSIFCGHGENEIRLAQCGAFERCLALDISTGALEKARASACQAGIENIAFEQRDLNLPDCLPGDEFDLVIANGALHHSMDLTSLLTQIKHSMKPNALFLSSEYVGPDYCGRTYRQEQLIRAMQALIPQALVSTAGVKSSRKHNIRKWVRCVVSNSEKTFRLVDSIRKRRLKKRDPSEAVHASMVIPLVRQVFPSAEIYYYGGSLLSHVVTAELMGSLDLSNPLHREFLDLLMRLEQVVERLGEVPYCNAFIIAWNE